MHKQSLVFPTALFLTSNLLFQTLFPIRNCIVKMEDWKQSKCYLLSTNYSFSIKLHGSSANANSKPNQAFQQWQSSLNGKGNKRNNGLVSIADSRLEGKINTASVHSTVHRLPYIMCFIYQTPNSKNFGEKPWHVINQNNIKKTMCLVFLQSIPQPYYFCNKSSLICWPLLYDMTGETNRKVGSSNHHFSQVVNWYYFTQLRNTQFIFTTPIT